MSPKAASALQAVHADPHPMSLADCPRDLLEGFAADAKAERHERHVHWHLTRRLSRDIRAIRRGLRSAV